jgi:hypothetical protein
VVVLPKGDTEDGRCERDFIVKPNETRPLALKNTDNKLCCSVWLRKLRVAAVKHARPGQQGIIPSRHFTQNVLDLDAAGRCYSTSARPAGLPVLVCWDFAADFPSLAHDWMKRVVRHMKLPQGLINVIEGIYHYKVAHVSVQGVYAVLFVVLLGLSTPFSRR